MLPVGVGTIQRRVWRLGNTAACPGGHFAPLGPMTLPPPADSRDSRTRRVGTRLATHLSVRIGAHHHDRSIEPCHPSVRQASCADRPIPFADYLHKSNREHDTFEMSRDCQRACEADERPPCPEREREPDRRVTRPEMPRTETVRRVEFRYEIQSSIAAGRLIDILL